MTSHDIVFTLRRLHHKTGFVSRLPSRELSDSTVPLSHEIESTNIVV
jgi:hypothetical protein